MPKAPVPEPDILDAEFTPGTTQRVPPPRTPPRQPLNTPPLPAWLQSVTELGSSLAAAAEGLDAIQGTLGGWGLGETRSEPRVRIRKVSARLRRRRG